MEIKKFKVYGDPGHSWIAVKKKLLVELKIHDQISPYSYMKGNTAYLEEDRDADLFITAYTRTNRRVHYITKWTNNSSRIRTYDSYKIEGEMK